MRPTLLFALLATSAFGFQGPGGKVDPEQKKALAAYEALQAKLLKAKSIKLTLEIHHLERVDTYAMSFLRDNYAKIVSPEAGIYQNGKTYYDYNPIDKEYWTRTAPSKGLPRGTAFSLGGLVGLESIGFNNEPEMVPMRILAKKWNGEDVRAIEMRGLVDRNLKATLYLGAKTGMPVGWDFALHDFKSGGKFKDIVLDPPMKPAHFAWSPPKGATKIG